LCGLSGALEVKAKVTPKAPSEARASPAALTERSGARHHGFGWDGMVEVGRVMGGVILL